MARTEKRRTTPRLPKQIAQAVAAAEDKKAADLVVLDLRKASGFTDYFVICSGQNPRQVRAIADAVVDAVAADGAKPAHVEGYDRSEWVLLDYFDFIVHVFAPETRLFYGLERLWGNAERHEILADPAAMSGRPRTPGSQHESDTQRHKQPHKHQ
jgi:ribosome-associated protein